MIFLNVTGKYRFQTGEYFQIMKTKPRALRLLPFTIMLKNQLLLICFLAFQMIAKIPALPDT